MNFALILIKFSVKISEFWFELKFAEFNGENRLAWLNPSGVDYKACLYREPNSAIWPMFKFNPNVAYLNKY